MNKPCYQVNKSSSDIFPWSVFSAISRISSCCLFPLYFPWDLFHPYSWPLAPRTEKAPWSDSFSFPTWMPIVNTWLVWASFTVVPLVTSKDLQRFKGLNSISISIIRVAGRYHLIYQVVWTHLCGLPLNLLLFKMTKQISLCELLCEPTRGVTRPTGHVLNYIYNRHFQFVLQSGCATSQSHQQREEGSFLHPTNNW